jgi:hypothetical protein
MNLAFIFLGLIGTAWAVMSQLEYGWFWVCLYAATPFGLFTASAFWFLANIKPREKSKREGKRMGRKTFEEAKAELLECAVGCNEYEDLTTWKELADAAAFESSIAADKASRLQTLLNQAAEESGDY